MSESVPEPLVMGIGLMAAGSTVAILTGAVLYTCLQAFYILVLPLIAVFLGFVLMFDQDTALNTFLLSTDASTCSSTSMLLKTVGALCMTYGIGTYYASKIKCQVTQAYFGFATSGVGAMLVYSLWSDLSGHDQKVAVGLVAGMSCLSMMKVLSPKITSKFVAAKMPYTGF